MQRRTLFGKTIKLRDVKVNDAAFILSLRTDEKKNRFLSKTDDDVEKQIRYINDYLKRDSEWYFIIESVEGEPLGTVRIYDIKNEISSFCWGSWLLKDGADITCALESAMMVYNFGFYELGFKNCHFDVRKGNDKVKKFHKLFGAKETSADEENTYWTYSEADYRAFLKRINQV